MGNIMNPIITDEALVGKSTNEINKDIASAYYVYEYFSDKNGEVENAEGKIIHISKGDVYYVGKGINNRVTAGIRNNECEKFKRELGFNYRIIKSGMVESEALEYEKGKINEYLENGIYLTNIISGSIAKTDIETLGKIKYLIMLCDADVINMTNSEIALELDSNTETVRRIRKEKEAYKAILINIPDNLWYFLKEYDYDKMSEKELKYSNIKYVLDLLEKGVIKASQAQIAKYYGENTTTISGIKSGKYEMIKRSIKPENIEEILVMFNENNVSDDEKNKGYIMYIIKHFIETGVLKMTVRDLVRETKDIYGISAMQIADIKRNGQKVKLFKPNGEIFAMLFSKYYFPD